MNVKQLAPFIFILGMCSALFISAFAITNYDQKQVDNLNDVQNAADYIEVFEYSGHEYLRYKTGNGKVGGLCHKEDCKGNK